MATSSQWASKPGQAQGLGAPAQLRGRGVVVIAVIAVLLTMVVVLVGIDVVAHGLGQPVIGLERVGR